MLNPNTAFEEELYYSYLRDPQSVSPEWRSYFAKESGKGGSLEFPIDIASENDSVQKPRQDYHRQMHDDNIHLKNGETLQPLSSIAAKIYENMEESLEIPTATSVRTIPVKALDENRRIINKYLIKLKRKKVSFTHILLWAIVRAIEKHPNMNVAFATVNGKPSRIIRNNINAGLAIDITRKDGRRLLLVPNVKNAQNLNFSEFINAFDELIERTRTNKLDIDDLQDTTFTLTNPGMIGTTFSSPRLMKGQGFILATGSIDYPTEFQAVRLEALTKLAISKVVTMTNTYDHRLIQGAESAEFLAHIAKLLLGENNFYDQIFAALKIPFEPVRWQIDIPRHDYGGVFDERDHAEKGAHVMLLINAYRVRGHLLASINPLGLESYYYPELDPAYYGFTIWDLDRIFHADDAWEKNNLPLRDIIEKMRDTYCGKLGIEFMHIQTPEKKNWIKTTLELNDNIRTYTNDEKIKILKKLFDAEIFENFLHTKFIGHKRFSLEGGESVIVMLDKIFECAADDKLNSIVLGMAHRGRLNVLVNNIGKKYRKIFDEFAGNIDPDTFHGTGDVKYHLGDKGVFTSAGNNSIEVILSPNPSHLELVDPVIVGMARAIDNEIMDDTYSQSLPIMIHGDSAFAGQGIVAETLNLSQLEGYKTGGTLHIIINNQIGFTTISQSARSTIYATDIAKMIQVPIIHVNGNDPEAVCSAAIFAFQYRQKFGCDVIIDMLCYRKYGHNEADEPSYTQPLLYKKIKSMPEVGIVYESDLIKEKVITHELAESLRNEIIKRLNVEFSEKSEKHNLIINNSESKSIFEPVTTSVPKVTLGFIGKKITEYPSDFNANPKVATLLKKRREMIESDVAAIDWSMGEALALGSILMDGKEIRFSGQDSRRGTFSQRHAVLTDFETEDEFTPLNNISENQAKLRIFDSPLSEIGVLGFEYGYSVISKKGLTIWEAQFGDFANGAQAMFDQFIAAAELKWGNTSNLTVLLPHSYDGQGPEHSSARLERYLQLCGEENMFVCNLSTPAQYFHVLRRQVISTIKKPLIIMTPKSMLRHPQAVSSLEEFYQVEFQTIIDDKSANPKLIRRVLFCSGKIYYEIMAKRSEKSATDVAIVRIEQLYPLNQKLLSEILNKYSKANEIFWVQEEPRNMGAWKYLAMQFHQLTLKNQKLHYAGRKESASTASGSAKIHSAEQNELLEQAFGSL
ncbi:MAG: multifunctional 2-oxoglutarate metabolism enzyme [Bacteroidota bacterium]|nr:multifunctional 2-oxoglutarate metabolism enzyme [Bacteroidota bacterium]